MLGLIKQFLRDVDWGDIDYLVVDTPPGTSDEHLSIVQYLSSTTVDGAVIITTPQEVSLMDVRKEISFCRKVNLPVIGVVENMSGFVCPKCKVCVQNNVIFLRVCACVRTCMCVFVYVCACACEYDCLADNCNLCLCSRLLVERISKSTLL